ncbi:kinase-like domain-containing protein [Fomitopsis betulina]|nr:kinase-like domain-containing protein [Fomitopsis betulina]
MNMGGYLSRSTSTVTIRDIVPPNESSDEEAYAIIESLDVTKNRLASDPEGLCSPPVWRISPDTVLKRTDGAHFEPFTMLLVSAATSIPVPKVRKYVTCNHNVWVFMEHVGGRNLEDAWPSLSIFTKLWIIWKLRSYIHQLRQIPLAEPRIPGPIDGSEKPQRCIGYYFTELSQASKHNGKAPSLSLEKLVFDDSAPLVLTHGDVVPRNVILGDDGRLWLIDWGFSGVYPLWLEYASMAAYSNASAPRFWRWFVPLMTGWYPSQLSYLQALSGALMLYDP